VAFNGRTQQVKHPSFSSFKPINMGVVQGSGLGPTLCIVMASDLKPLSVINILFKFADDTTFLVPENTDIDISVEFEHFRCWAKYKNMNINLLKTKEIVFCRPFARSFLPLCLTGIERVMSAKLLSVTFCSNLKFDEHVKNILTICSQHCYLLKCLKVQGLPAKQLSLVFSAIVVSRIIYALPAWDGFLSNDLIAKLDAFFLKKCFPLGLQL